MSNRKPLIGLLVLMAGCTRPIIAPWVPDDTRPHRVVVFGDSLAWEAEDEATAQFALDSNVSLSFNSFPGTQISSWTPAMATTPSSATAVVALGTNDIDSLTPEELQFSTHTALNRFNDQGVIQVVWLTLSTQSASQRTTEILAEVEQYNRWLRWLVGTGAYPALRLEEWDHLSAGHPEWLREDNVHHTEEGQQAYAMALVEAGG